MNECEIQTRHGMAEVLVMSVRDGKVEVILELVE